MKRGVSPDMPVAVIDKGTRADQQIVIGTLANIFDKVTEAELQGPSLVIVGTVVHLSDSLGWFKPGAIERHNMTIQAKPAL